MNMDPRLPSQLSCPSLTRRSLLCVPAIICGFRGCYDYVHGGTSTSILTSITSLTRKGTSVKFAASDNYDVFSRQEGHVEVGQKTFNSTCVRATLDKGKSKTVSLPG